MERASKIIIDTVQGLKQIAQDFPATAPIVMQVNDLMRQIGLKMMQDVQPPQPAAPPVNG